MELKKLISGQMIKDVSGSHIPDGSYGDARNIIVSDPTSGDYSRIEKIVGTKSVSHALGYSITKVLGSCTDDKNGLLYLMCEASTGNKIISVELDDTVTTVLDYDFGWLSTTVLNDVYFLQDSIIWIDNSDEIKRFPLGIYPVTPTAGSLDNEEISIAKKPPLTQPYIMMWTDDNLDTTDRDSDYQFATYFEYADGGRTVLSPYSRPLTRKTRNFNRFYVYPDIHPTDSETGLTTPPSIKRWAEYDSFPKNAIKIVVCARNIRSDTWYEIGSLNRVTDLTEDNNYGKYDKEFVEFTAPLAGIAVPVQQLSTQYFVPEDPKTITVAGNRILSANFHEGKSAPETNAAFQQLSTIETDSGVPIVEQSLLDVQKMDYYAISWNATTGVYDKVKQTEATYTKYAVMLKDGAWYDTDLDPVTYTPGDTITIGADIDTTLQGTGVKGTDNPYYRYIADPTGITRNVRTALIANQFPDVATDATYGDIIEAGLPYDDEGGTMFPSRGSYRAAVVFSGAHGRKSDVLHDPSWTIIFDKTGFSRKTAISYNLQLELLGYEWARSAEILLTGNVETASFLEGNVAGVGFKKVDVDGNITYESAYANSDEHLAINLATFIRDGGGYSFEEGDVISIYNIENSGGTIRKSLIDIPIVETEGTYVLVSAEDYLGDATIDTFSDVTFVISRKRDTEADTIFYGTGVSHPIPEGTNGKFRVSGLLSGDTAIDINYHYVVGHASGIHSAYKTSTEIVNKTMSQDEDGAWIYGRGKAYIETNFGEVYKENYVRYGGQIINDTKINGLGDFLALDEVNTDVEFGEINKLQLVGDDQGQGTVVLAICPLRTTSLYVGSSVLSNADGTTSMIKSEDFIGMVRPQSKEYGTIHPESVFAVKGKVFWYDNINSCFVMYASNGLHEISTNGLDQFFREKILKTSTVICGYYDTYEMLMITIKNGYNSYNDTIGYDTNNKAWRSFYDLFPDVYARMNDVMYVSKDGLIGKSRKVAADDTTYSNFFNVQYDSTIKIPFNADPSMRKLWTALTLSPKPDSLQWNASGEQEFIDQGMKVTITNEDGQLADIEHDEFEIENNVAYGVVGLDQNSPGGITDGEELMSKEIEVEIEMTSGNNIQIGELSAGFQPVDGQAIP
jgi:hypothetical protein